MKRIIEKLLINFFPASIYRFIGGLWGYLVGAKKSYSQYGEDLVIENFFKAHGKESGVYVDIGAFHPKWLSNTYRLYKLGWKGAAVDIDTYKIKLFEIVRKNCKGFIGAVAPISQDSTMHVHRFRKLWSEIDTLSLEDAKRYEEMFNVKFDTSTINTISINEVLNQTTKQFGAVNFINIDIEGLDEAILFDMDFNAFQPDLICFENNLHFAGSEKLKNLLASNGYQHLFTSGGTHGYFRSALLNQTK